MRNETISSGLDTSGHLCVPYGCQSACTGSGHAWGKGISFWAYFGAGGGSYEGPLFFIGQEVARPYGSISLHMITAVETLSIFPNQKPIEWNGEIGVLYGGWLNMSKKFFGSAAIGISRTKFIRRGRQISEGALLLASRSQKQRFCQMGIPVAVRLHSVGENRGDGLIFSFVANYNRRESFWAIGVGIFLGG